LPTEERVEESIRKISIENASHYTWGNECDGWHFVNRPSLSIIRERMPAGTSEVRHYHAHARQFFFVLTGTAAIEVGGARQELRSGEGVEVPPGAAHQISNESRAPLEFLVVSQPHSHGDRVSA
jgi:mannose-6-phosphate isomerase-like protein (cupin superfamily)